jgi:NADH-quinone oxidoreductase subunit A
MFARNDALLYLKIHMLQNKEFLIHYLPIAVFFAVAVLLSLLIVTLPKLLAPSNPTRDKLKPYECGFDALVDSREKFDVKFYLIAILFIIFDIEVAFLVPWAVSLKKIGPLGFWSMLFFLAILIVGFIYEWKKGALDW